MGAAASLFFSSDNSKETLHRRITPTDDQYDEQVARWNELADWLTSVLSEETDLTVSTWLQGSYKFGTQIRPVRKGEEFDIDLGLYFRWEGKPSYGKYGPKALKEKVQSALETYDEESTDTKGVAAPPKMRCCRIHFENDFHIDVPTYHLRTDKEQRHLATQDNDWEDSDPKAFYTCFKDRFDDALRVKVRRYIRYFKAWSALKFRAEAERPSSVLLTTLVSDAVDGLSEQDLRSDDTAVYYIVHEIYNRLNQDARVPNPADPNEDLASRLSEEALESLVSKLLDFEASAGAATATFDVIEAADRWSDVFEHLFPLPESEVVIMEKAAAGLPAVVLPEVLVRARLQKNITRSWSDVNRIGPIPKYCDINFEIINSGQFPAGTVFDWTVRNFGQEAELINDLGHKSTRGESAYEQSAYNGTHYMDCRVSLNGRMIALRRVPVIISGVTPPPRQKPMKRQFRLPGRR